MPDRLSSPDSPCVTARRVPVAAILLVAIQLVAALAAADISGTVFRDIDLDGVQDAASGSIPAEPGVRGAVVSAFSGANPNTPVASATTNASGAFTLTLGAGTYRIEVTPSTLAGGLAMAPTSLSGAGRVSFVANGTTNLAIGLAEPKEFCQNNPDLVVNCYVDGNQVGSTGDVLVSFARLETGESTNTQTKGPEAQAQQIGTTWGLAYQRSSNNLFAGSYLKRHTGFGNNNNGASNSPTGILYRIPNPGNGSVDGGGNAPVAFVNLNTLFGSNVFGANPHTGASGTQNDFQVDTASFSLIGKRGMGGIDISDDGLSLWVVNLNDRQLYRVPLGTNPSAPVAPTSSGQVSTFSMAGLFSNCTGLGDFRPFAVKAHEQRVYVGAVCTGVVDTTAPFGPPTQFPRALVFRFNPITGTFDTTPIVNFTLDYTRGCLLSNSGTCFNGTNAGSTPANNTSNWRAWIDASASTWIPENLIDHGTIGNGSREVGYPQPMLTDLEFDSQGSLLLGLRDRFGDQMGYDNDFPDANNASGPDGFGGTDQGTADAVGDLLRATLNGDGLTYTISVASAAEATEFYAVDEWNDGTYAHSETASGGIANHAPSNEVATSGMDPLNGSGVGNNDFSAGVRSFDADAGTLLRRREVYDPDTDGSQFFGKANGLGDLELLCNAAPIQVGDRVWRDHDRDGVQDPGEPGLAGVTVQIWEDTDANGSVDAQIGSVTTDANGRFLFGGASNLNLTGGQSIDPHRNYQLRLVLSTLPAGLGVTTQNYNGNALNGDLHDSDGDNAVIVATASTIAFTTGGPGSNDQTRDFGVRSVTVDWGDLPNSYATLAASNGANHSVVPGFFLGSQVDGETDGQPNATATGDDAAGVDDEDGVTFTTPLAAGRPGDITVVASAAGVLNVWADYDGSGGFGAGEQVVTNQALVAGSNLINDLAVPGTLTSPLALRFRFTQQSTDYLAGVAPTGIAITGEVEDYFLGCISGRAWDDTDVDGIRDVGEPLRAGVVVRLLTSAGAAVLDGAGNPITTTTSASGTYSFCGLPPATYRVQFDNPLNLRPTLQNQGGDDTVDSDASPANGQVTGVVVTGAATTANVDVGYEAQFAWVLGDTVFLDLDRDGIEDIGEPGIPQVLVTLYRDDGDGIAEPNPQLCSAISNPAQDCVVAVTATDVNGQYQFSGSVPGTYFTAVNETTLPDDPGNPGQDLVLAPGNVNPSALVTVGGSANAFFDLDFGYVQADDTLALVGDLVWSDADDDGVRDAGEPGLGGVDLALVSAGPDGVFGTGDDVTVDTTTSLASGVYYFFNVAPGTYRVDVLDSVNSTNLGIAATPLAGWRMSTCAATDACPQGQDDASNALSVLGDDHYLEADFPYVAQAATVYTIADRVWFDLDSDGTDDGGTDPGIRNVTVSLVLDDGDGVWEPGIDTIVATDLTDATGNFSFAGVPSDGTTDYLLLITDVRGELVLFDPTTAAAGTGTLAVPNLSGNVSGTNFGYNRPGSIGDTVWIDSDGDGLIDGGEVLLGGVTVRLYRDSNSNGLFDGGDALLGTQVTAADGSYLFSGLGAGPYIVSIDRIQPALSGFLTSPGTPDQHLLSPTSDEQFRTLIATGAGTSSNLDQDFGYLNPLLPPVRGTVFLDADRDGFLDATGEPGFPSVTVVLVNSSGVVVSTATTNGSGDYEFTDVPAGSYTVRVTDDAEILVGYELTSGLDAIPITVAGSPVEDIDFGYARDARTGSIGDTVWLDASGDGQLNGSESGISGTTVELYTVGPDGAIGGGDDTLVATTTTALDGRYLFATLPPGNYYVRFADSTGGVGNGGTPLAGYSRTDSGTSTSAVINLSEGAVYDLADSGWRPSPGTGQLIGDTIFYDANGDGLKQGGEVGLAGVDVRINGPGIPGGFAIVQTDAAGRYLYQLPVIGATTDYYVTVCTALTAATFPGGTCSAIPASLTQTTTSFVTPQDPNGQNPKDFSVQPGVDRIDADFGFLGVGLASVGDTVFLDRNGNGVQDGVDPGIEGVTVALVRDTNGNGIADPGEPQVDVDTTDLNGNYDFQGVDPAFNWVVVVTDLGNVLQELNVSTPPTAGDVPPLAPGSNYDNADFGYAPRDRGTIGNQVWRDLSGGVTGLFEAGEPGIPGVSVKLWLDNNGNGIIEPGIDNCVRGCVDLILTDPNGQYEFRGLPFADYVVEVTDELNVLQGLQSSVCTIGNCPDQTADNVSKTPPYATTLSSGTPTDFRADFGYVTDPGTGDFTLSGLVYFDAQPDGDYTNQTPLEDFAVDDVVVSLFIDLDFDGIGDLLYATQVTSGGVGATVNYTFTDLPPASWVITVDGPGTEIEGADQTEPAASAARSAYTCSNTTSLATCQASGQDATEVDFGFNKAPTLVLIADVRTYQADGDGTVVFEFETVSELGASGFFVWRLDPRSGSYVQVNRDAIAADRSPRGATYRVLDPEATPSQRSVYVVYESEESGGERAYGPFEAVLDAAGGPRPSDDVEVVARPVEREVARRLEIARAEASASVGPEATSVSAETFGRAGYGDGDLQSIDAEAQALVPARIQVRESGLQRVQAQQIAAAMGTDLVRVKRWIGNGQLRLTQGQRQVSWRAGAGGDSIVFYGSASDDPTSAFAAYRLRRGAGRPMSQVDGGAPAPALGASFTDTLRFEQQAFAATVVATSADEDFWFWKSLNGGHPSQGLFQAPVQVPAPFGGAAELRVVLFGASGGFAAVDHEVTVRLNGVELGVAEWAGRGRREFSFAVPGGTLVGGDNQLQLVAAKPAGVPFSFVYVDAFELDYERGLVASGDRLEMLAELSGPVTVQGFSSPILTVYRLGNGFDPALVVNTTVDSDGSGHRVSFVAEAGARYVAIVDGAEAAAAADLWSDWTLPTDGAEYVVVAPRQLMAAAQQLAAHRADQGYQVLVVELEALEAAFADGEKNAEAVRVFFQRAWQRWSTKPRFAVLFGKGSFDVRNVLGLGGNLLPPKMVRTPTGLYASDLAFADVEGDDGRPEFAFGRIPALTASEALAYVGKLIEHENAASSGRVLLASDNADGAGDFAASSSQLEDRIGGAFAISSISLDELSPLDARAALKAELEAGSYWLNYYGHGAADRFAAEALLHRSDVATIDNGDQLPIVTSLTCSVGRFEVPGMVSLAETLTLASDRGAIAVLAPTGTGFHAVSERIGERFFAEAFEGRATTLGEAWVEAVRSFDGPVEQLGVYQLFGDPAVPLQP
ncbi:MAG: hypothetical protein DWQ36_02600 [Acidobacteria bacterium]|nr:MAG: hypothetical protein DWQ30_23990 [Acidobacteriota bacterium]REK11328.1 MAG: hypothetical protein DWQ36_02600 [Acidobacteriota bacterium]